MRPSLIEIGVVGVTIAGCNGVLGLDERPPRDDGSGGMGAMIAAGGMGNGGAGASTADGGAGGATSTGGAGGMGGSGSGGAGGGGAVASCNALAGSPSGVYQLDPDVDGPIQPFTAHCDMDFDSGGWTLVVSTANDMGPGTGTPGVVLPGTNATMPVATVIALAEASTQVHIRTIGQAATRSATSTPSSLPIVNLRLGKQLERTAAAYDDAHWVMGTSLTHANMRRFNMSQPCADAEAADPDYPVLYQACNNQNGLHILGDLSTWNLAAAQPEPLEVYVR